MAAPESSLAARATTGTASGCTSSPARAAPARRPSPPRSPCALASGGRRTLVVEVEGRQGLARLFDADPLPYEERKVAVAPGGGEVLRARRRHRGRAARVPRACSTRWAAPAGCSKRIGAVDFATTIAPGLRDVLLTGKVYEAVGRRRSGRHGVRRRRARRTTDRSDRALPQREHRGRRAGQARPDPHPVRLDHGPAHAPTATVVHLVTLLEEMPVQETVDGIAELHGARAAGRRRHRQHGPSTAAARRGPDAPSARGRVADAEIIARARGRGPQAPTPSTVTALLDEGADLAARVGAGEARAHAARRRSAGRRTTCRCSPTAVDLGGLYALAEALSEQGVA